MSSQDVADIGTVKAAIKSLQKHGVTTEHLKRIASNREYAVRIANYALRGGLDLPIQHRLARLHLGHNFFGVEEWFEFYGVRFAGKQMARIREFPWGEDLLNAPCPFHGGRMIKETHFAFLGIAKINGKRLTIQSWHKLLRSFRGCPVDLENPQLREAFAQKTCRFRWYLMPLTTGLEFKNKSYVHQLAGMPDRYEVATAIEEFMKRMLYYRKHQTLFGLSKWSRSRDYTVSEQQISVVYYDRGVISTSSYMRDVKGSEIDLSVVRS